MSDLATTVHNIPPAAVAKRLRGARQWAVYQTLAEAGGHWVEPRRLAAVVYGALAEDYWSMRAVYAVIRRLKAKGIPVEIGITGYIHGYRLPLDWQRSQDTEPGDAGDGS